MADIIFDEIDGKRVKIQGDKITYYCEGINLRGYWKGYPCSNDAKYIHNGCHYCHVHFAIAVKEPDRFRKVAELMEKRKK